VVSDGQIRVAAIHPSKCRRVADRMNRRAEGPRPCCDVARFSVDAGSLGPYREAIPCDHQELLHSYSNGATAYGRMRRPRARFHSRGGSMHAAGI